jgi:hypothetical protein
MRICSSYGSQFGYGMNIDEDEIVLIFEEIFTMAEGCGASDKRWHIENCTSNIFCQATENQKTINSKSTRRNREKIEKTKLTAPRNRRLERRERNLLERMI